MQIFIDAEGIFPSFAISMYKKLCLEADSCECFGIDIPTAYLELEGKYNFRIWRCKKLSLTKAEIILTNRPSLFPGMICITEKDSCSSNVKERIEFLLDRKLKKFSVLS